MNFKRIWQQAKNMYHFFQAHAWRLWYGMPDKGLHVYGVTGTNGKTTTVYMLDGILAAEYGRTHVGMLTTVAFRVGKHEEVNETKMTTLKSRMVFDYLRRMRDADVRHVALEVTSHALDQHRLAGIRLDGAIFLNVVREHLDYHGTMDAYARAKAGIVRYLKSGAPLIANGDDERVQNALDEVRSADYKVRYFSRCEAKRIQTPLESPVNKENALAATRLAREVGISQQAIERGLASVDHVPGRMEWIDVGGGVWVVIDYALTPDVLDRLYAGVRETADGRVIGILGGTGLRDRGKRPDMTRTVMHYADELILTREDPWTEPEAQIYADLERGLADYPQCSEDAQGPCWRRIEERREAIRFALEHARRGDIIVLTGKGAETGMAIGQEVVPWNERDVVEALARRTSTQASQQE